MNNMPYNPMMNAQQRLQQMEQAYPQFGMSPTQTSILNGRMIDDFSNIKANDVPMDNVGAIFIKSDGTEIQRRTWNNDGFIETTSYKPILDSEKENADKLPKSKEKVKIDLSDEATEGIMNKFDEIMKKIDSLEKSIVPKQTTRAKKEVDVK
jgi:hypothetical protein